MYKFLRSFIIIFYLAIFILIILSLLLFPDPMGSEHTIPPWLAFVIGYWFGGK